MCVCVLLIDTMIDRNNFRCNNRNAESSRDEELMCEVQMHCNAKLYAND